MADARVPSPQSSPSLMYPYSLNFQSSTSVAIIIVVLGATFFFMFLFVIYVKRCNAERIRGAEAIGASGGVWSSRQQLIHGLDPEILKKLPVVQFSSMVSSGKKIAECAVCLGSFEDPNEFIRLLPACGHVFHTECIDIWFRTHSTCPLCRRSLDTISPTSFQLALPNLTSNNEISTPTAGGANEPDIEAGGNSSSGAGQILRALSRNSESFKLAAHSLEIQDVRDRLWASGSGRFASPRSNSFRLSRIRSLRSDHTPALTPIACGRMHHSQSLTELAGQVDSFPVSERAIEIGSPVCTPTQNASVVSSSSSGMCFKGETTVKSERWTAPKQVSSFRRSLSASSSSTRNLRNVFQSNYGEN